MSYSIIAKARPASPDRRGMVRWAPPVPRRVRMGGLRSVAGFMYAAGPIIHIRQVPAGDEFLRRRPPGGCDCVSDCYR